jgi:NAD+ synthetase
MELSVGLPYPIMVDNIRKELETYLIEKNIKSLVLGISGGIDSALCVALARPVCDKLGISLIGRSIPISTNTSKEIDRAQMVGNAFCTDFDEDYQLESVYSSFWSVMQPSGWDLEDAREPFRKGNLKARIRMILLYDLAQLHRGMVLSTDNYTELLLGFWTLHGDVGDYGMIQKLWKSEVYGMAEYLVSILDGDQANALQSCIDCQATDGLGISNTDLDQIMPGWTGSSRDGYNRVDHILFSYLIGVKEIDGSPIEDHPVIKRHLASEFKRNNPFNIKRSLIFPKEEKEHQKQMITVDVYSHNGEEPYTKEYLDKLNLEKADVINIHWEEEEYRSDGGTPAGWYIDVQRTRLETDDEFAKRIKDGKITNEDLKKRRYENYLKLKKEFEE